MLPTPTLVKVEAVLPATLPLACVPRLTLSHSPVRLLNATSSHYSCVFSILILSSLAWGKDQSWQEGWKI